jgi:hypothetical protein
MARGDEIVYDKTVYSTEKALYHRDRMEAIMRGDQPYPVHVEIIISDFCNHDCFFCLDGDTLVLDRNNNHRQIRDIRVGDVDQGGESNPLDHWQPRSDDSIWMGTSR